MYDGLYFACHSFKKHIHYLKLVNAQMNITRFHDFSKSLESWFFSRIFPGLEITIYKSHDLPRFSMNPVFPESTVLHRHGFFSTAAQNRQTKLFYFGGGVSSCFQCPHCNKKRDFFVNCGFAARAVNSLDDSILHVDVSAEGLVIVHNLPAFDEETVTLENNRKRIMATCEEFVWGGERNQTPQT